MEYEFTFIVSGVTVDDDEAVRKLRDAHDAMLLRAGGLDQLVIAYAGDSAVDAAIRAATAITSVVPKIRILRLDRDLVGVAEIADRTDRSRQNVAQWVNGERLGGGGSFPLPEGTAGRSHVWLWSEVNAWLASRGLDDGCRYPSRAEMADIDYALRHSVTMSIFYDTGRDDEFAAQRQAVIEEVEAGHYMGLLTFLAGRFDLKDAEGRYVAVIAAPDESAQDVMRRIAAHGHDVLLISNTDRFVGMVMSTRAPARPVKLRSVGPQVSTREWLRQVNESPHAQFVAALDDAPPMERKLTMAA